MLAEMLPSVCPHDCPSVCALEVERLDGGRLGKVRGSQPQPLHRGRDLRQGRALPRALPSPRPPEPAAAPGRAQGLGSVRADRLGRRAGRGREAARRAPLQRHGSETVWPYFYAGTMGLVQRDGINRLRHAMRYSGWHTDDLRHALGCRLAGGLRPALGRARRGDGALRSDRDLGHQSREHPGQRHDPRRPGAQGAGRQAGRGRPLPDRHRRAGGCAHCPAPGHRRRARLRGDARAVPGRPCRSRLPREIRRRLAGDRGASRTPDAGMGSQDHRPAGRRDRGLRDALWLHEALLSAARLRLHPLAQRRRQHARRFLSADRDRRLSVRGRRCSLQSGRSLPLGQDPDRGPRSARSERSACSISRESARF